MALELLQTHNIILTDTQEFYNLHAIRATTSTMNRGCNAVRISVACNSPNDSTSQNGNGVIVVFDRSVVSMSKIPNAFKQQVFNEFYENSVKLSTAKNNTHTITDTANSVTVDNMAGNILSVTMREEKEIFKYHGGSINLRAIDADLTAANPIAYTVSVAFCKV